MSPSDESNEATCHLLLGPHVTLGLVPMHPTTSCHLLMQQWSIHANPNLPIVTFSCFHVVVKPWLLTSHWLLNSHWLLTLNFTFWSLSWKFLHWINFTYGLSFHAFKLCWNHFSKIYVMSLLSLESNNIEVLSFLDPWSISYQRLSSEGDGCGNKQ